MSIEHLPPDLRPLQAMRRRAALERLVGTSSRVRVVNPHHPDGGWTGRLKGLADHPTLLIERSDGKLFALPQAFEVIELDDEPVHPALRMCARCDHPASLTHRCVAGTNPDPQHLVPVLFLDLDSTVRKGHAELGRFVNDPADVEVFPAAVEHMRSWKNNNHGRVVGITNQGGIALGHVTAQAVDAAIAETQRQADSLFDLIQVCPHHPDAATLTMAYCWCRKPNPGAITMAIGRLAAMFPGEEYAPALSRFVGDRPEDEACAREAGIQFTWAGEWRRDGQCPRCDSDTRSEHLATQAEGGEVQPCLHPWHDQPAVAR
ncbi:MAG: HAD-IIIA family hydrolase, partial [Streptosporangiaceae bacterium]